MGNVSHSYPMTLSRISVLSTMVAGIHLKLRGFLQLQLNLISFAQMINKGKQFGHIGHIPTRKPLPLVFLGKDKYFLKSKPVGQTPRRKKTHSLARKLAKQHHRPSTISTMLLF